MVVVVVEGGAGVVVGEGGAGTTVMDIKGGSLSAQVPSTRMLRTVNSTLPGKTQLPPLKKIYVKRAGVVAGVFSVNDSLKGWPFELPFVQPSAMVPCAQHVMVGR